MKESQRYLIERARPGQGLCNCKPSLFANCIVAGLGRHELADFSSYSRRLLAGCVIDNNTNTLVKLLSGFAGAALGAAAVLCFTRRAIRFKEIEDHTEFKWTPRSFNVQARLGWSDRSSSHSQCPGRRCPRAMPALLDGLYTLSPKSARPDLDSLGGTVRSQLAELVHELGKEGGPRVFPVDRLPTVLLGNSPKAICTQAGGGIGALRDRFGRKREFPTLLKMGKTRPISLSLLNM